MNRKQLIILVVLGVVIGGAGLYLAKNRSSAFVRTGLSVGGKLLPDFPMNEVSAVRIAEGTNQVSLSRAEAAWVVDERDGYPADFGKIGDLLRDLWDMTVTQNEGIVGPSQLPRLELVMPGAGAKSGTFLEFKNQEGTVISSLLLGKQHLRKPTQPNPMGGSEGYPDGRYVLVPGKDSNVFLISDALNEIQPQSDQWLDKDFFKVEKTKMISVTDSNQADSWKLTRESETGDWVLADATEGETLDSSKISSVGRALSYPSFTDVVGKDLSPAAAGMEHPLVARLDTFDGFSYLVKVGDTNSSGNYRLSVEVNGDFPTERMVPEDEDPEKKEELDLKFQEDLEKLQEKLRQEQGLAGWTYLVSKYTVEPLLKTRPELLKEPEPAEEPADSTEVPAEFSIPAGVDAIDALNPVGN